MSQGKSGFELRTDILGMAMGMLENNRDQTMQSFYSKPEEDRKIIKPRKETKRP